jgi:hypothetical protein
MSDFLSPQTRNSRNKIHAHLALGRLDGTVRLAGRHGETFAEELEEGNGFSAVLEGNGGNAEKIARKNGGRWAGAGEANDVL